MSEMTLTGHCLCGAVKYETTGEPLRFVHCHCERCRRATGTGHATNILLESGGVDWKGTDGSIKRFKLPEAERFGTAFCTTCGGPLPRVGKGIVVIPAGTLDAVPDLEPQGRIFFASRVEWSCADELPSYDEYPTG